MAATRGNVRFDRHGYNKLYSRSLASQDFGEIRWFQKQESRLVRPGYLQIKLPSKRENVGFKMVAAVPPRSSRSCVTTLRFARGFDWGNQNDIKLPCGLGGGTLPTGGNPDPDGGFTVRFVVIGSNRNLGVYAYHAEQPRTYGEFFDTGVRAKANQWYTLKVFAKKNNTNRKNGWLGVTVNGSQRIGQTMKWSNQSRNVDTVFVTCFRGGGGNPPDGATFVEVDTVRWW